MALSVRRQFPTTMWRGYAPGEVLIGEALSANFNVTTDQAIQVSAPARRYVISAIIISNASISLTTAQGGFFTAASKGGTTLVATTQAYSTLTAAAVNAAGSAMSATLEVGASTAMTDVTTIYFSLTTAQGAAASADIRIFARPLY